MSALSVVLPTFNRLERLTRVLEGLAAQDLDRSRFEVVVVSDGSTDGTDAYLSSGRTPLAVRSIRQDNQGPAAARNAGIEASRHELVLFLDDDVVPDRRLVGQHLRSHQAHGPDVAVIGPMVTPADAALSPWVRWEQAMLYKQYRAIRDGEWVPSARQFYTGNASLRRDHLVAVGGFDTGFRRAEDVELAYRLAQRGLGFVFDFDAVGYHYAERDFAGWRRNARLYGAGDVAMGTEGGHHWILPTVRREFDAHHRLVRWLVRGAVGRPTVGRPAVRALEALAGAADRTGCDQLTRMSLSGIYNLTYYDALVEALGSRQAFFVGAGAGVGSEEGNHAHIA